MGPSERKKKEAEALRQRILDAAEEIFVTEGIQQVTMRRIAACIGYAPTVLYRLFANKNDLMDHLIARGYQGVRQRYDHVLEKKGMGPRESLQGILDVYVKYALKHPNHYRMWFDTSELRQENQRLRMNHRRLEYVVFQTWVDGIEACQKVGMYPNMNAREVFQIIWSRIHGLISLRIQHPDFPWLPVDRHLSEVLDLHSRGTRNPS
jgi:AcrR family transcriptional regulator